MGQGCHLQAGMLPFAQQKTEGANLSLCCWRPTFPATSSVAALLGKSILRCWTSTLSRLTRGGGRSSRDACKLAFQLFFLKRKSCRPDFLAMPPFPQDPSLEHPFSSSVP